MPKKIEINEKFQTALDLMEKSGRNVFITGRAGTGKSTLLDIFRKQTKKRVVVLAPTGVAALNVGGQTIHSFFHFKPNVTLNKIRAYKKDDPKRELFQKIKVMVIDEISMVRADLIDCVDKFMRLNGPSADLPFGGVQVIFIGDLYQLPPVVTSEDKLTLQMHYETPYFFSAKCLNDESGAMFDMAYIELDKIYRQEDEHFINVLNAVRNNSAGEKEMAILNARLYENFLPAPEDFYIYLTTTNDRASEINLEYLDRLPDESTISTADVFGDFERKSFPTDIELEFKVGAQIMMLNNDLSRRWVNGTIGHIISIEQHELIGTVVIVEFLNGRVEEIHRHKWDLYSYYLNKKSGAIESKSTGSFTQFPFRLAWAITIHKSQGKTFEKVILDIGRGTFAHGQMYVALSRCTTLEGLVLKRRLSRYNILMDMAVVKYMGRFL